MKLRNIYIGAMVALLSFTFLGCEDDIEPLVEKLELDRVLTPIELEARIRNRTTIELEWATRDDADHYVVEFSEDSLEFNTIIRTVTVDPGDLPVSETFFGDTRYSARVKGVSAEGVTDSKWAAVTVRTDPENIFEPLENADIGALDVTINWPAGSEVSHFIINPGNINRPISAGEESAGEATITGLTELTNYTVVMYNDSKIRGTAKFKTLVDTNGAILVQPTDDLNAVITGAAPGAKLVLTAGDYTVYAGSITVSKSIAIYGQFPYDKPIVHVQFELTDGVQNVAVGDLEMTGDETRDYAFKYATDAVAYGSLSVSSCYIHDYAKSLFSAASGPNATSTVQAISLDNSIVADVLTSSADFIDFRNGHVVSLTLTNSTFNNCAPGRDFIRLDNSSGNFPGFTMSTVLIDHCTLYGVSNTQDRILYVRYNSNTLTVQNTLIAATDGYFTNQSSSSQPICSNNNYFNAPGFYTAGYVSGAKIDESGNHLTLDPGFADGAEGDFTISNQTLIDKGIGDPRWRP